MQKEINFAISQIEITPGQPDKNVEKIIQETENAKKRKIDVILFPEMAVPGYLLGDEWENDSFIRDLLSYNQEILEASHGIAIFWGNIYAEFNKKGEDGRTRKFNAVYVAQNGKWVENGIFEGKTFKTLMPKYREFDDERHFYSMQKLANESNSELENLLQPFPIKVKDRTVKIGAILCEDMWCDDYAINPTNILVKNGAEVVVNLSASPWTWRKNDKRHRVVKSLLEKSPVPFLYCNNVGIQNNGKNIFLFDGASTAYNPDGSIIQEINDYKEETRDVTITDKKEREVKPETLSNEKDVQELYNGLIYGIRKFFDRLPNKKVVIGLSGGVDSAVVACLLTSALGKENVYAINMPSKFNSDITKNSANELAKNLGITYQVLSIQEVVDLTKQQLEGAGFAVNNFVLENIQARDRGSRILAGVAASLGAVFTNNGNKTETALGYATLYGDVDGAIAPIADLYKWEVYQLAEYINTLQKKIIPDSILNIVPSAELSENQDVTKGKGDPILYPYHDKLIRAFAEFRKDPEYVLDLYLKNKLEEELKIEKGLLRKYFSTPSDFVKDLEDKWKLFKVNYFKRIQSPPIISVSRRAFGFDLRESQNGVYFTKRFLELKEKILRS